MLANFTLISIIDPLSHKYNLYDVILRSVTRSWNFAIIRRDAFLLVSIFLAWLRRKSDEKNYLEAVATCDGYDLKKAYSK